WIGISPTTLENATYNSPCAKTPKA
ncbi:unnamed protein product, partial [Allacma fusca]